MASARLLNVHGTCDGIRFGDLIFEDAVTRRFHFDRLTGAISLWFMDSGRDGLSPEVDPHRLAEAERMLIESIGTI